MTGFGIRRIEGFDYSRAVSTQKQVGISQNYAALRTSGHESRQYIRSQLIANSRYKLEHHHIDHSAAQRIEASEASPRDCAC